LEQTMKLADAFEKFAEAQNQSQLIQYNQFVGKNVRWHELTDKKDEAGTSIVNEGSGVIQSAKFVDGSVVFTMADGKELTPGNISEVLAGVGNTNSLVEASLLIGKTVGYVEGEVEKTGTVVSVSNKEGNLQYILEDGSRIDGDSFISISQ
jgi:flagellar basal-body rod modification protein FlgD